MVASKTVGGGRGKRFQLPAADEPRSPYLGLGLVSGFRVRVMAFGCWYFSGRSGSGREGRVCLKFACANNGLLRVMDDVSRCVMLSTSYLVVHACARLGVGVGVGV